MYKITVPANSNTRLGYFTDTRTVRIINLSSHDGLVLIVNGQGVADIRRNEAVSSVVSGPISLNNNDTTNSIEAVWTVF